MRKNVKSVMYATLANGVGLLVSLFISAVIPKYLADADYGYWQYYFLFTGYAGFAKLGLQDGIILRYGKYDYKDLDKKLFHSELVALYLFEFVLAAALWVGALLLFSDVNKVYVFRMFLIYCIVFLPSELLQYILLMTNRIAHYSIAIVIEKASYGLILAALLLSHQYQFKYYIWADILCRAAAFIYGVWQCREIVFNKLAPFKETMSEIWTNCKVGIIMMLANISSLLLLGITRFFISENWEIEIFGDVSFAIGLCNFILVFLTAVGQVLFPILKRAKTEELPGIYTTMNRSLTLACCLALCVYPCLELFVNLWLPNKIPCLIYLCLILPVCVYEVKANMLLTVYFKVLRKEKQFLLINIPPVVISLILSVVTTMVYKNIKLAVLTIVISCGLRSILSQAYFAKVLDRKETKVMITDICLPAFFILSYVILKGWRAFGAYAVVFVIVAALFYRSDLQNLIKMASKEKSADGQQSVEEE